MEVDKITTKAEEKMNENMEIIGKNPIYVDHLEYAVWIETILWSLKYHRNYAEILQSWLLALQKTPESAFGGIFEVNYTYIRPNAKEERNTIKQQIEQNRIEQKFLEELSNNQKAVIDNYFPYTLKHNAINKETYTRAVNQLSIGIYDLTTRYNSLKKVYKQLTKVNFVSIAGRNSNLILTPLFAKEKN